MILSKNKKGFTLIELMVGITIVSLISSVVIFSYRSFTQKLALSAAAQEIAVAIRQAQTYGTSVKESGKGGVPFDAAYGVVFSNLPNSRSYYILFADVNRNGVYDGDSACASTSECVEKNLIRNGAYITDICGAIGSASLGCPVGGAQSMTITFKRPEREAYIYFINAANNIIGSAYTQGQIKLGTSSGNFTSSVVVNSIGQISTQ